MTETPQEPTFVHLLRRRAAEEGTKTGFTFLADGEDRELPLTYGELARRSRAVAARLAEAGVGRGDRVALLYPAGLDFIAGFFGTLQAGAVAVPVHAPRRSAHGERLASIVADCGARVALTTGEVSARSTPLLEKSKLLRGLEWIAADAIAPGSGDGWSAPEIDGEGLAMLQYTSGSTSRPKGVMLRHRHLMANNRMVRAAFQHRDGAIVVSWLPMFHDMGLIGTLLQPLYLAYPVVLMAPEHFLMKPVRWLRAISRWRGETSGGPNFAYDLCARKVTDEQCEGLDLSSWSLAFSGAEPVRGATLDRFAQRFAPHGFQAKAFYPCYGLAEATLLVTGGDKRLAPPRVRVDGAALAEGWAVEADGPEAREFVSCGWPWEGQQVAIVDPWTNRRAADGEVGEIWVHGQCVADGYWRRAEESERVFRARVDGEPGESWLRTGDLGFMREGRLYVTGRLKDLIIIAGRNHFAEDIEHSVGAAQAETAGGGVAAFSVDVGDEERLVIAAEVDRRLARRDPVADAGGVAVAEPLTELARAIRETVAARHDLRAHDIVLLRPASLPRTTSGKIRRGACRTAYNDGTFNGMRLG